MFLSDEFSKLLHKLTSLEEKLYESILDDTRNNILEEIAIIRNEINAIILLLSRCGK